ERLDVDIGSRMVLSFQDTDSEITGGAFRVAGIFDTFSNPYDESNVFVKHDDLNRLLGLDNQIHTIWLYVDDFSQAGKYVDQLNRQFPDLQIQSWAEIAPDLNLMFSMLDLMLYI